MAGNPFGDSKEFKQSASSCEIKTHFIILCNQFTHLLKNVVKLEPSWICAFFVKPTMQGVYAKTELCLLDVISCSRIIRALSPQCLLCEKVSQAYLAALPFFINTFYLAT